MKIGQKEISRDEVLLLILIMKVVPLNWFYSLAWDKTKDQKSFPIEVGDADIRKQMYDLIYHLERQDFVEVITKVQQQTFVILTKKGFDRMNKPINGDPFSDEKLVTYKYASWNKAQRRSPSIHQPHNYFIFRFMYEYFGAGGKATSVYTDYDIRYGRKGRNVIHYKSGYVRPDAIIIPRGEGENTEIIAVEADTHAESQRELYDKILQYLLAVQHQVIIEDLEQLQLYFTFKTTRRRDFVFSDKKDKGITKFFEDYSNFQKSKKTESMSMKNIMKLLKNENLQIFGGTFHQAIDEYKEINLRDLLIKQNKRWKKI